MASDKNSYHEVQQDGTAHAQISLNTYSVDSHMMNCGTFTTRTRMLQSPMALRPEK